MFEYLSNKISSLFDRLTGEKKLSSETVKNLLDDLKGVLIDADVPLAAAQAFLADVEAKCVGIELRGGVTPKEMITKSVYDSLVSFLGGAQQQGGDFLLGRLKKQNLSQQTILIAGLQGAGKTTTISKLILQIIEKEKGHNAKINEHILVVSLDYTRPAARDQLRILAERIGVAYYESHSQDPIGAAKEGLKYAREKGYRLVFFDTAGRLHVDKNLLEELKEVYAIVRPSVTFLVLDGMMGQASLAVAREFSEAIPFDGAILTKMDSGSRAGAAFSFSFITKKPIVYIGVGEKPKDLELFRADRIARRLLGMGDIESLVESANAKIAKAEEELIQQALKRGDITIDGYISVLNIIDRMGSWKKIFSMMPRSMMPGNISEEHIEQMDRDARMFRVMSASMTPKERQKPALLINNDRCKRIAKGSGLSLIDVERLMKQYNQMKDQMKMIGKFGRFFA